MGRPAKPGPVSSRQECGFGVTRFADFTGEAPDFRVKYTAFYMVAKKSNPDEFGPSFEARKKLIGDNGLASRSHQEDPCLGWVICFSAGP